MSAALLAAEGLCKRYGAIQACRDISFEIEEGEALAIVSPGEKSVSVSNTPVSGFACSL